MSDHPGALLQRLARALDQRCGRLAQQLHPGWRAALPERAAAGREASLALAALYGVRVPGVPAWRSRVHRLALLERDALQRALACAALHAQRFAVRRSVTRADRDWVTRMVGAEAHQALLEADTTGAPQGPATLQRLEPPVLAEAGCRAIADEGLWRCGDVVRLVQLSLAPATEVTATPTAPPVRGRLAGFEDLLPRYLPEFAWLFGSDMDRALSASKTV